MEAYRGLPSNIAPISKISMIGVEEPKISVNENRGLKSSSGMLTIFKLSMLRAILEQVGLLAMVLARCCSQMLDIKHKSE
jgi:hypothetical protein